MSEIVNKVAESGLLVLDLETLRPKRPLVMLDVQQFLSEGVVLREAHFRHSVSAYPWNDHRGTMVCISNSQEAIVPLWASMLLAVEAERNQFQLFYGSANQARVELWREAVESLDISRYSNQRVVLKGCDTDDAPEGVYAHLAQRLLPVVQSLFYGEPCSTVPIFKRPKGA